MKKTKIACVISMVVAPLSVLATGHFPHLCRVSGVRFEKENVIFFSQHTAKPRLYVIHNVSKKSIWLTHETKNVGAMGSAGWASQLTPNHWSAMLVTKKSFYLGCHYQEKSGHMVKLPCDKLIHVCQYSDFYSKNPIGGGYWVAENLTQQMLEPHIRQRGFVLRK